MKNVSVINIFNFIRLSNEEPTRFIEDDFITVKKQIEVLKQLGLPSTYALKYDALCDSNYQELLKNSVDKNDEIAAWWEINAELCYEAGVEFRGKDSNIFDNRVGCAYSIGYEKSERRALIDAYMKKFLEVFKVYPKTISSWVLDIETFKYAKEKYGVVGGAICRDQIATDGFTLIGPYVNGAYYPSINNEVIPAQTIEKQLDMPIIRLLGPDPIYSFESGLREGISGVYSLEPVAPLGRDKKFYSWMFKRLSEEEQIGMSYLQVGQENNFLWDNIKPGFEPQLNYIKSLSERGKLRIETLETTTKWFKRKYKTTPPSTFNASVDYNKELDLKTLWYSSKNYRVSFLFEKGRLSVRDLFVYNEDYKSRYLENVVTSSESVFDALPIVNPHYFSDNSQKNEIRFIDKNKSEIKFKEIEFKAVDELSFRLTLKSLTKQINIIMNEDKISIFGDTNLLLLRGLSVNIVEDKKISFLHENFKYCVKILKGKANKNQEEVEILNENSEIVLNLAQKNSNEGIFTEEYLKNKEKFNKIQKVHFDRLSNVTPREPKIEPCDVILKKGEKALITISSTDSGEIYYCDNEKMQTPSSKLYQKPFEIDKNSVVSAYLKKGNKKSEPAHSRIFFAEKISEITSDTVFDKRPIFNKEGVNGLINKYRGTRDYQDTNWLGTLEDLDVTLSLSSAKNLNKLTVGFISNHRTGVIFPKEVSVYLGNSKNDMKLYKTIKIENKRPKREIETKDVVFGLDSNKAKFIRLIAKNYKIGPDWACYKGLPGVFLFTDSIIIE